MLVTIPNGIEIRNDEAMINPSMKLWMPSPQRRR